MIICEKLYRLICSDGECPNDSPRCETREELIDLAHTLGWEKTEADRWVCPKHAQEQMTFCDKAKQL